jgi:hypothetical protein
MSHVFFYKDVDVAAISSIRTGGAAPCARNRQLSTHGAESWLDEAGGLTFLHHLRSIHPVGRGLAAV